jgi:hypothetical protein
MKMHTYQTAAQAAHADLLDKLSEAQTEARQRQQQAAQAVSDDTMRPHLLGIITNTDTPTADTVAATIASFAAMMPAHKARDGAAMIAHLTSIKKHNGLSDKQAGQVIGAMMACIHGKASAGLTEWPSRETWHHALSVAELHQWAEWAAPDAYAELQADVQRAMRDRFEADRDLARLESDQKALDLLAATQGDNDNVIRIANPTARRQRIGTVMFEPEAVTELTDRDYAAVVQHGGFQRLIAAGDLAVVAA